MKDKTNLKIILAVIVSVIISSGITAFAAIKFQANEIGYNTTTVADALDSLYQTQFSDNYSTTERVVGKWIDGKPLYQKTIMGTVGSNIPLSTVSSDIDSPVALQFRAGWYYEGMNGYVFDSYYQNNNNSLRCMIEGDHILAAGGSLTVGREIIITIQYTKTTDQATN